MGIHRRLEDLVVYQKLCRLHLEVDARTRRWPAEEKYELAAQIRCSSNRAPALLAGRYDDRHVYSKLEGIHRSRSEAAETVHHFFMAHLKGYEGESVYDEYRARYQECIRILNGMERALEQHLPDPDRRESSGETPGAFPGPRVAGPGYPEPEP
jgi:four helix bundle protein